MTENDLTGTAPDAKLRTVSILPAVGLAVKDNLVVGVGLSYTNKKDRELRIYQTGKRKNIWRGRVHSQVYTYFNKVVPLW